MASPIGLEASADWALGRLRGPRPDVLRSARFRSRQRLSAQLSSFASAPHNEMIDALRRDYTAMTAMIFGQTPPFEAVLESIQRLETILNG